MSNPTPQSPIMNEALQRRNLLLRAKTSYTRFQINILLGAACLYDANNKSLLRLLDYSPPLFASWLFVVEMAVFIICLINIIVAIWNMMSPMHGLTPIPLTDSQYKLLSLPPDSPGFTKSPDKKTDVYPNPFSPIPGPLLVSTVTSSPNTSITSPNASCRSWASTSPSSPTTNLRRDYYPDSPSITDEAGLSSYLSSFHSWEQSQASNQTLDDSGSQISQSVLFWRQSAANPMSSSTGKLDFSPGPNQGNQVYELSTPPLPNTSSTPGSGEKEASADKAKLSVLSQRLGIDPLDLVGWNENLRVWLTQTVLRPVVAEIDAVNVALPKHGIADCLIGQVPVERLRKVSSLPQVVQHIPHLSAILPFLDVCLDQTYLVRRLRDLAKTGALSQFRWNGGGDGWSERLPSDSEVILHCLAAYLDSRLLTSASMRLSGTANHQTETMKPFTGVAFYRHGEKPDITKNPDVLAIVQVERSPAHYVVQVGAHQIDVGSGRNNLIHTILLFLYRIKQDRNGMLGRVNLGLSGLNMLWVLD